jgi:hypothetical protein
MWNTRAERQTALCPPVQLGLAAVEDPRVRGSWLSASAGLKWKSPSKVTRPVRAPNDRSGLDDATPSSDIE